MGSSTRDKEKSRRRSRSRSRSRDRRRSRSKDKYRRSSRSKSRERRSRSRSRERGSRRSAFSGGDTSGGSAVAQIQAEALAALQQQQLQRQLMAQQLLLQTQTLGGTALSSTKKQREVYIGNLTIGVVNDVMLRELFNGALASLVPDPVTNPPVVGVTMDPSGRYAFVEMRTEELSTSAMQLDKLELCGRSINVGRPKGYVEPPSGMASQAKLGMAQMFAAQLSGGVTNVVLLENLVNVSNVRDDQERRELYEEVTEECKKCGPLQGLAIPKPPPYAADTDGCRVYVKYATTDAAGKCKKMMDGRMFDSNRVKATHVTEVDFNRAQAGEWIQQLPGLPPGPLPGPPPLVPGMMPPNMGMGSGFH